MEQAALAGIDAVCDVFEEDSLLWQTLRSRHDCVQPARPNVHVSAELHAARKVQAELVQPQDDDGDAVGHLLDVHGFLLQALQLHCGRRQEDCPPDCPAGCSSDFLENFSVMSSTLLTQVFAQNAMPQREIVL